MPGLEKLLTEQRNPASAASIDTLPTEEVLRIVNAEDHKVAGAVEREIPAIARAVDAIVAAFERGGRLFYIGAGTSGRPGRAGRLRDSAHLQRAPGDGAGHHRRRRRRRSAAPPKPPRTTRPSGSRDLLARGFTGGDVLVGIAASGRTPYVLGAVAEARRLGAVTVGISCTPDSELARAVAIAITPLVGPEVVAGSTRMKAGTAQKLVLNMLSTGAFVRLGYVYGNLMVNVQPKNRKLVDRAGASSRRRHRRAGAGELLAQRRRCERAGELLDAGGRAESGVRGPPA
jgi:N-acetylmuramic acid 6-phosphate etherase